MNIVAVSQRVDSIADRAETRDALDQAVVDFLAAAGSLAVPVPNTYCAEEALHRPAGEALAEWLEAIEPGAVVLSGGNDIGGCPARDRTENHLLSYAVRRQLPVLGVCRGMQMLAKAAGTGLKRVAGHVRSRHPLGGVIRGEVNSYHEFALADCPDGYEVIARSADGVIEAIRHKELPWEGWMWHPEREAPFREVDLDRARIILGGGCSSR